ncbi:Oidioi.mRNA.OKI2018_I69.chr1.g2618.t1.cds [Oikopleura dioica]|uniref:Oidioi.mRNA.OKI2018_I69.chr1.g2618.t1.cds n=1 Tax=Oikopleura dioica TaxID=34765 RepID=A0ABN7SRM7_OIKDI|nr:Oidioi.mRNA.OKI2018_I69.chr1.g2618.t1.cds [Oikopleura dioica]
MEVTTLRNHDGESEMVLADCDPTKRTYRELSFKAGDTLRVVDYFYSKDWALALDKSNTIGLVHHYWVDIDPIPWLIPNITRTNAEFYLKDKKRERGCFVVRCSQSHEGFSLSIKLRNKIGHMRVHWDKNKGHVHIWKRKFRTITDLVDYYLTYPIFGEMRLLMPDAPQIATSLYPFEPTDDSQLCLQERETIQILAFIDRDWYLAMKDFRKSGGIGTVPRKYIEFPPPEETIHPRRQLSSNLEYLNQTTSASSTQSTASSSYSEYSSSASSDLISFESTEKLNTVVS